MGKKIASYFSLVLKCISVLHLNKSVCVQGINSSFKEFGPDFAEGRLLIIWA